MAHNSRDPADLFLAGAQSPLPGAYQLLGADCSYYTAKISACLRYKRIPHQNVLATRAVFTNDILPRVGWPVIPVLLTPEGNTLQDTSDMFDHLERRYPTPVTLPLDPAGRFLALLMELAGDEWLKIPALHYRWTYDAEFAANEFGYNNDPEAPLEKQRALGRKIAARFSGWTVPLGANATSIPCIEAEYRALLRGLDEHFASCPFLLGQAPTLADFAFYGPLHAHLYRDPASGAVMRSLAPNVVAWVKRIGDPPPVVPLPPITTVPPTLMPVLRQLCRDLVPVLLAEAAALQAWLAAHDEQELPRDIGTHEVVLGRGTPHEIATQRAVFPYDHWMLQRALAVYRDAGADARRAVETVATAIGAGALLDLPLAPLVQRQRFRLLRA